MSSGLCRLTLNLQNALVGFNGFDCAFDEASIAAKALMKAATAPHFDSAVTSQVSTCAFDKTRGATVGADKTAPIILLGIVSASRHYRAHIRPFLRQQRGFSGGCYRCRSSEEAG
jgi:hypothetical protein